MSANTKKYYWLKLKEDFFNQKYVKALRKLPDGDSLTIIYLKMQLMTLNSEGKLTFEHIMPTCEAEIALALDEDENKVRFTIEALLNMGIVEKLDNDDLILLAMSELIGSESQSAKRVREFRKRQALQCNKNVTTEIEKEIEKEKDIDIENNMSTSVDGRTAFDYKSVVDLFNSVCVSLPKVAKLSENRKRNIKNAHKQLDGNFEDFFHRIEQSDFLTGRSGSWNGCSFDWILKSSNLIKILEGNYDNKNGNSGKKGNFPTLQDYLEEF